MSSNSTKLVDQYNMDSCYSHPLEIECFTCFYGFMVRSDLDLCSARSNKPGKEDDWFCKKCKKQKKEAGEWKPSQEQQHKVEVDF